MSWTDERIDTLKTMWEAGQTASQIAEALGGVSRNAVIGKAHRLGLQSRPSPVKPNEPVAAAAPEPEVEPAPVEAAPPPTVAAPRPAPAPEPEIEDEDEEDEAPVVAAPIRRGLFAPTPAGYIEGDFIAAQRVGDRWIVVAPRPEGFPTAWQSRVMLWFLLSFALVAPFGWLFARRITAPLRSFADAAERLGRDPSAPATVQGGSAEIGRAAAAFNLMQGRLKRYVDDRTAMIGAISHDLRTPLTRMRFRLEAAPDKLKPGFETDIDQMEAMISSVLTFMRDQAEG
ncbi:MAG: GcrA family cell cycle regulator, partial [Sphingomonas sp.]